MSDNSDYTKTISNNIDSRERGLTPKEVELIKKQCEDDIYLFAIRYFSHYLRKSSSDFHKFLYKVFAEELNRPNRTEAIKYAIAAPRGNSKSSIVSTIVPIWCMAYYKKRFIIMLSDTATKAEGFLSDVKRELLNNAKLNKDFPDLCGKGSVWRANEIITNSGIKISALGTGNNIRGEKFGNIRPQLLLLDDLENSDMLRSESERDFIQNRWFKKDVLHTKGEKGTIMDIFVVGTVLGKESLLNALLDRSKFPDWRSKRFSAVLSESTSPLWGEWKKIFVDRFNENNIEDARKFFEKHKEDMLRGTKVLWPEGDPYYDLMVEKVSDYSGFLSEKQNSPIDYSKIMVQEGDIHWENFLTNPVIQKILRNTINPSYGAIDPALGKKADSNDYYCIPTIIRDLRSGYLYVVDFEIDRQKVDYQIDAIVKKHLEFRYKLFGVETNAFQYVLAENLRTISRRAGIYVPVKEINNSQDKKLRVEGMIPFITDGTLVFDKYKAETNQMYDLAMEQILTFTGENDRHDDACVLSGSFILTNKGVKEIQDVKIGDEVLTHTGSFNKVTKTYKRDYSGEVFEIKGVGTLPTTFTSNHRLLVSTYTKKEVSKSQRTYTTVNNNDFCFEEISKLDKKKHLINTPCISYSENVTLDMSKYLDYYIEKDGLIYGTTYKGERINPRSIPISKYVEIDEEMSFFLGYFAAEGSTGSTHSVNLASHKDEVVVDDFIRELLYNKFGNVKIYVYTRDNLKRTCFNSVPITNFLKLFKSKTSKRLPEFCMRLGKKETLSLLFGYLFGDDNFTEGVARSNTISPSLAFQIYLLFIKVGLKPRIRFVNREKYKFDNKFISRNQYYVELSRLDTLDFLSLLPKFAVDIYKDKKLKRCSPKCNRKSTYFSEDETLLSRRISYNKKMYYEGKVYNLEVEGDNSYVVNGIAVHNCDSLEMCFRIAQKSGFQVLTKQNR